MRGSVITRVLVAGTAIIAMLTGFAATATAANASTKANWNIPWKNIHYSDPACVKHMSIWEPEYGGMICTGYYRVNRSNYKFTQDDTNSCPALGTREWITLHYVISP